MTQASLKGRLPELKHLDISENENLKAVQESFFSVGAKWERLKCLVVDQMGEGLHIFSHTCDCFSKLEEIQLKKSGEGLFNHNCRLRWQSLTRLELACSQEGFLETVTGIVHNVENDILPSLEALYIKVGTRATLPKYEEDLYNLWKILTEKLRPVIYKQIIDCIEQLNRCSPGKSFSQLHTRKRRFLRVDRLNH